MPKNRKKVIKVRKIWSINPKTRIKDNEKLYSRKKEKNKLKKQLSEEV